MRLPTHVWGECMVKTAWYHHLITCIGAAFLVTTIRMMGTFGDINGPNLSDTVAHSLLLVVFAYPLQTLFAVSFMRANWSRVGPSTAALLGCVLAAFPISFIVPTASWLLGVLPRELPEPASRADFVADLASRYHFVLLGYMSVGTALWSFFNLAWWRDRLSLAEDGHQQETAVEKRDAEPPVKLESVILEKVPFEKRGRILGLSAEQHYVRVITDHGESLVLMRFSDAVALCNRLDGIQVHRSHWARRSAIRDICRNPGKTEIVLETGHSLPVSRSYRAALRGLSIAS